MVWFWMVHKHLDNEMINHMAESQNIVAVVHALVLIAQKSGFHILFSLWTHYQTI